MADLKRLLNSSNILEDILSFDDETLFSHFKELSNLDFYLNRHGMSSRHEFTVIDHTKRLVKNFSLSLKYRNDNSLYESELLGGTRFKKDFFKRLVNLINDLNLETDSDDFRAIVLTLLLHDVGKGSYDKSDKEIKDEASKTRKDKGSPGYDYLKLLYKTKDHEERGAFLVYSLLEEVDGISQSFAKRVKHLIQGHGDLRKLQVEKDFNFHVFLRRIMDYTSEYNYPIIHQENPEELLIHELNINYLIFLLDIYSVDDRGETWYSVRQGKETIYLKAKWLLGKKLEDLLIILSQEFPAMEKAKQERLFKILKKNFLQSLRTNSNFLLGSELEEICTIHERKALLTLTDDYLNHTSKMHPLYLNQTSPQDKWLHINLLKKADGKLAFHFTTHKDTIDITLAKTYAPKGSLLKIVNTLISTSIECGRTMKIIHLNAYSGEDNRLIDMIRIKHVRGEDISDSTLEAFTRNLKLYDSPDYQVDHLELPITQEELDDRAQSLEVELNEVEIGSRKFQELRVKTLKLSNLTLYSCLNALSYYNIIDVNVQKMDSHYIYAFLLSQWQTYKITSTSAFKNDLIDELKQNVVVTA
ncbi:MAG TPA: hypothetical protein ENI73_02740 [Spirochaetes bacterium]|nr:hypothetical protein [Spirochaetota bacterium]